MNNPLLLYSILYLVNPALGKYTHIHILLLIKGKGDGHSNKKCNSYTCKQTPLSKKNISGVTSCCYPCVKVNLYPATGEIYLKD